MRCYFQMMICFSVGLLLNIANVSQAQIAVPLPGIPQPPIVVPDDEPAAEAKAEDGTEAEAKPADKKDKDKKKADSEKKPEPPKVTPVKKKNEPVVFKFMMSSGSIFSGQPLFKEIKVSTEIGDLVIPAKDILEITPGLDSRPDLAKNIKDWVEKLNSEEFNVRETAKRELINLGPAVEDILREYLSDKNAERIKELNKILTQLQEISFEQEDEGPVQQKLMHQDKVVTVKFTILGKVETAGYKIKSKELGELTINPNLLTSAIRKTNSSANIVKRVKVDGTQHIAQRSFKNSRITVRKGDVITISASGMIIMTPWGSSARSTPDGQSRYGKYKSGIYAGTLVAKIGSKTDFKIGSRIKFTAKSSGVLHFGIGMNSSYKNYSFPGTYDVRVRVERK